MAKPARRAADVGSKWQINPLVGAKVPPDVDWLIAQLAKINSTNRPNKVVVEHAFGINGRLLHLRIRERGSYKLHGNIKDGFRLEAQAGGSRACQRTRPPRKRRTVRIQGALDQSLGRRLTSLSKTRLAPCPSADHQTRI